MSQRTELGDSSVSFRLIPDMGLIWLPGCAIRLSMRLWPSWPYTRSPYHLQSALAQNCLCWASFSLWSLRTVRH